MANAKKSSILNRMNLAGFQSSTKIEALREELALMLARDPSAKALVFSQFTSMLDLVYYRLQQVRPDCPAPRSSLNRTAPFSSCCWAMPAGGQQSVQRASNSSGLGRDAHISATRSSQDVMRNPGPPCMRPEGTMRMMLA